MAPPGGGVADGGGGGAGAGAEDGAGAAADAAADAAAGADAAGAAAGAAEAEGGADAVVGAAGGGVVADVGGVASEATPSACAPDSIPTAAASCKSKRTSGWAGPNKKCGQQCLQGWGGGHFISKSMSSRSRLYVTIASRASDLHTGAFREGRQSKPRATGAHARCRCVGARGVLARVGPGTRTHTRASLATLTTRARPSSTHSTARRDAAHPTCAERERARAASCHPAPRRSSSALSRLRHLHPLTLTCSR